MTMKICALLTCFNRLEKTVACLREVQNLIADIDIYLVDDGSTDHTREAVEKIIKKGKVISGSGDLFWSRGMAKAWQVAAASDDYDYYLWLNDDIVLKKEAIEELLACARQSHNKAVITGLIADQATGEVIYGGSDASGRLLQSTGTMQDVVSMNGNCVLVSREIYQKIGTIDPVFHHDLGDVDYGLRARKAGFAVMTTRTVVADGYKNLFCRVRKSNVSFPKRIRALYSPLGNPPDLNFKFRLRHKGIINALLYLVHIHAINFMSDFWVKKFFGARYD